MANTEPFLTPDYSAVGKYDQIPAPLEVTLFIEKRIMDHE